MVAKYKELIGMFAFLGGSEVGANVDGIVGVGLGRDETIGVGVGVGIGVGTGVGLGV